MLLLVARACMARGAHTCAHVYLHICHTFPPGRPAAQASLALRPSTALAPPSTLPAGRSPNPPAEPSRPPVPPA